MSAVSVLLESLIRGAIIAIVAVVSLPLLRNARAAVRAALLDFSIAMLAILPLLQLAGARIVLPVPAVLGSAPGAFAATLATWPRLAAGLYVAGVLTGMAFLAISVRRLACISRRAARVSTPVWRMLNTELARGRRVPSLRTGPGIPCALSWGWRAGTILLDPASHAEHRHARAILAHEQAHLRRGDWPLLIVARVVLALHWCNPFVWILVRARARVAEEAADAVAIRAVEPIAYAEALLHAARRRHALAANAMPGTGSHLRQRVSSVLAGPRSFSPPSTIAGGLLALVVLATAAVAPGAALRRGAHEAVRASVSGAVPVPVPVPTDIPVPMPVPVPVPMHER